MEGDPTRIHTIFYYQAHGITISKIFEAYKYHTKFTEPPLIKPFKPVQKMVC